MEIREAGRVNLDIRTLLSHATEPSRLFHPESVDELKGLIDLVDLAQEQPVVASVLNEMYTQSFREQGLYPNQKPSIKAVDIKTKRDEIEFEIVTEKPFKLIDVRGKLENRTYSTRKSNLPF